MKKYIYLLFLCAFPALVFSQGVEFRIDTSYAIPGDSIVIPVRVRNFENAGSATIYVQYNASAMTFGRALDWHPSLQGSIFLASSTGNTIAVVWADINGASISDDVFVNFKFRYNGGAGYLTFTNNSEVTDIWGEPIVPSPVYTTGMVKQVLTVAAQASLSSICVGQNSTLSMQTSGGQGNQSFYWYSVPAGFTSGLASPVVSPLVNTTYYVLVTDQVDTAIAQTTVNVFPQTAPGQVTNMIPSNNTEDLSLPVNFSFGPSTNTSSYQLKLWDQAAPAAIYTLHLGTALNYSLTTILLAGKTYEWKIISKNPCFETDGMVHQFTMAELPDLVVETVLVPPTSFSGQSATVSWVIKNQGIGSTYSNTWNDVVYLSADTALQGNIDYYLGSFPNLSALNPQESYTRTLNKVLPQGISGNYYIIVLTGNNITYPEAVSNNNLGRNANPMVVNLSPTPDLQVTQVALPDNVFSGQSISLGITIQNKGEVPTQQSLWRDRVYFSADTFFTASSTILGTFIHSGILAVNQNYQPAYTVTIPPYVHGTFYIYVVTDVLNQVYEHALENNNVRRSSALNVFLTPPADLVPTQVSVPSFASTREQITVSYTVFNDGINPATVQGGWTDSIYISNSPLLNISEAIRIGVYKRTEALPAGQSYSQNIQCIIPSKLSGPHYIHVYSDVMHQIFEFDQEENNILKSNQIQILNPDIITSSLQVPDSASSGMPITLNYYHKNNGPGNLHPAITFRDSMLISNSPVYDPTQVVGFGVMSFSGTPLAPGDSSLVTFTANLPNGLDGLYYLYVLTDKRNTVTEGTGENNNIAVSPNPVQITLTPWADLLPESIVPENDTINAGATLHLSYVVRNIGPGQTQVPNWKDLVCISTSPFGPENNQLPKTVLVTASLAPDSAYTMNITLVLPKTITPGAYFVYLIADSTNKVYEHTSENNNILRSDPIWIEAYPPTNLELISLHSQDSASSGFPIEIGWSVRNLSASVSYSSFWEDRFYFSEDQAFEPGEDHLAGIIVHNGLLGGENMYTNEITLNVPNGLSGNFYLLGVTDFYNANQDPQFSNNVRIRTNSSGAAEPVFITYTAPPDLVINALNVPVSGISGQPITVDWVVLNQGAGEARPLSWTDKVYLSINTTYDQNDILLGGKSHSGGLKPDSIYNETLTANIPFWAEGNYMVILISDANNQVFESGPESNNTLPQAILVIKPAPGDLIVSAIIPPVDINAGETADISWSINNLGSNPVTGKMRDIVYLSKDTIWDSDDIFFASNESIINLGVGASLQRNANAKLIGATPGQWYVLVRTNVTNGIHESDFTNNTGRSDVTFNVTVPILPINVWAFDTLSNSQPLYYQINIPDSLVGESLRIQLKGDSILGNNEFYLRFGDVPGRSVFDIGYSDPGAGNQELLVPFLLEGTYYLLIYGNTLNGNLQNISLHASIMDFVILAVEENSGGNTGQVTLKMTGSKFSQDMQVYLNIGQNKVYATSVFFENTTRAYPTFDLTGLELGLYNIAASKSCNGTAILNNAFTVVEGEEPNLQVNLVAPTATGPNATIAVRVEFNNAGNTNLINPSRKVINLMQGPVSLLFSTLNIATSELELYFEELGGPPGILRPGANGSLIIYSKSGVISNGNVIGVVKND
jgi:hypothetical protein